MASPYNDVSISLTTNQVNYDRGVHHTKNQTALVLAFAIQV